MDPNECLKRINDFIVRGDSGDEVDHWCRDLMAWLDKDGFEPAWERYPMGTSYYRTRMVVERKAL